MSGVLRRFIAPPVFADEDLTRTAAVLNSLIWYLVILDLFAAAVGLPFLFAARIGSAISIALLLVALMVARGLMRLGRVRPASRALVIGLGVLFALLCVLTGGIYSVNLVLLVALAVVAGHLLGPKSAVALAASSSALALTLAVLEVRGTPPPQLFPAPPLSRWVELSIGFALALVPLTMSLRSLAAALQASRRELQVRLRAEAALRESEERFHAIYDSVNEAVFVHDVDTGAVLDANRKATELYGWSREEILALPAGAAFLGSQEPGFGAQDAAERIRKTAEGEPQLFEWHARNRNGRLFWVEVSLRPAMIGGQRRILASVRDIDERRQAQEERARLEEQLRQAQRLESVGRLAGGIAHDFNNLLTGILGNLELALAEAPDGSALGAFLEDARGSADRAAELTGHLLAFSRKQPIEPSVLDPGEVLDSARKLLAGLVGERVRLVTTVQPDSGLVKVDRTQLEHVLVHLALNARDAMPDGGRLTIELAGVTVDRPPDADARPGAQVRISVSDTGVGMSDEVKRRVFEPYFSATPRGKSTGLDLAMVHGAVKQNHGWIDVRSEVGRGTTFDLYLPRADVTDQTAAPAAASLGTPVGHETLLLVEDETAVREVARHTLAGLGYRVLACSDAEEALDAASASAEPIHLLLTDVILPGINGKILAERLAVLRPGLRVLYMSGYTENVLGEHGVLPEGLHFLPKPFTSQALASRVRAALGSV